MSFAGFAGLHIANPRDGKMLSVGLGRDVARMIIHELCGFAGLIPVDPAKNTRNFHSVEQNNDFVENLWITSQRTA